MGKAGETSHSFFLFRSFEGKNGSGSSGALLDFTGPLVHTSCLRRPQKRADGERISVFSETFLILEYMGSWL